MDTTGPAAAGAVSLEITDHPIAKTGRPESGVSLWWLGQAGFLLRSADATVLIDPYLSDSLAAKYKGGEFPHLRMMPAPVRPEALRDITHVFCTHGHTDHLDPGTLPEIAAANPGALFVVPRAVRLLALERGIPEDRLQVINAGEGPGLLAGHAVPSAHEEIQTDSDGNHLYLGYVFTAGGITFYHSGDTIPYAGLAGLLKPLGVDVALLPINGRDEYRRARGVPGNLTVGEAYSLAEEMGADYLLCHHWGMFDFNTVNPEAAREELKKLARDEQSPGVRAFLPEIHRCYRWTRSAALDAT
jgi:L-ascorbate metabolism protein UlaG (beta-lactamase superfamily)